MKTAQDWADLMEKMDNETTRIGDVFTDIFGKLRNGGLTAEEEEALFARGEAHAARLVTLGHDPDNPIPPVTE